MKVCYTAGPVKKLENCFSVSTNAAEIRIWFLTDDILRIRAGFDGDWDEASYSLTMTAWDSRHGRADEGTAEAACRPPLPN